MTWTALGIAAAVGIVFFAWLIRRPTLVVTNKEHIASATSPLTGEPCAEATRRPLAVMLSSDPEARPLSGLAEADMVFEMPVTPNGITRLMAVFQCADPREIGSIRSAREPFIPLAQGLNAILAHWGGERDALAQLNAHVIDNIDALIYEGSTYYRKPGIPKPHNGFTTPQLLRARAAELGYAASASIDPYVHTQAKPEHNLGSLVSVASVSWPQGMDVSFRYDANSDTYLRWRGGTPEIDALTGQQVSASVVIIMDTDASFLYDQYISVRVTGQGMASIYQDGKVIRATWKKAGPTSMLTFMDAQGHPVPLTPGKIWVLIDAPLPQP
ncbi:MAG TPA: DUF3048 domain-containing protein [Candidatus Paceibacterota bacterium]|nr:DUF3048 domain-containing protein [Candidatus Paceibacterota bacterium]